MDSSSEGSFTWTRASTGSEDSEDMKLMNHNDFKEEVKLKNHKEETEQTELNTSTESKKERKSKKRKHENDLFDTEEIDSPKKKKIKTEPESDADTVKKKKKKKHIDTSNGSYDDSFYEDEYLDMQVKQEKENHEASTVKHKKRKMEVEETSESLDNNNTSAISENLENGKKAKKKKKSHSKDIDVDTNEESFINGINHSEEEIKEISKKSPKKKKSKGDRESKQNELYDSKVEDELTAENTYQDYSESPVVENGYSHNSEDNEEKSNDISNSKNLNNFNNNDKIKDPDSDNGSNDSSQKSKDIKHKDTKITTQRTPKLSDRIRFEEEIESDSESYKMSKGNEPYSSRLRKFLRENINLQSIQKLSNKDLEITDDDEIWILKCPNGVDINELNKSDIHLDAKAKIKVNGETYCGTLTDTEKINIMSCNNNGFKIKQMIPNGIINFRKRLPKPHFNEDNVMVNNQTDFIPLPETKVRHPLFGSNYKETIHISNERLNQSSIDHNASTCSDKKKKKKHKKEKHEEIGIQLKIEYDSEVSDKKLVKEEFNIDILKKKNKKQKKSKRIKHEPDSADAWESEKAIEENLFNF